MRNPLRRRPVNWVEMVDLIEAIDTRLRDLLVQRRLSVPVRTELTEIVQSLTTPMLVRDRRRPPPRSST